MSETPQPDWSNATWDGNRRARSRAALALTVRERLLAMESLGELSETIAVATGRAPAAGEKTVRGRRVSSNLPGWKRCPISGARCPEPAAAARA